MTNRTPYVALGAAVALLCVILAYAWFVKAGSRSTPVPVAAITAAPAPSSTSSALASSAPQVPQKGVVYVINQSTPAPASSAYPNGSGEATVIATPGPLSAGASSIPQVAAQTAGAAYSPPPPPVMAPNAAPRIITMSISSGIVHSGEIVSGHIETSTNVASVEARIGGYASALRKVGAGRFYLQYRVPYVPFFLRKTYTVRIIARNTRGEATSAAFPITVR